MFRLHALVFTLVLTHFCMDADMSFVEVAPSPSTYSTQKGFVVTRVPKSDRNYISFKLVEDIQSADVTIIQNFFMSKEGFFMCDIKENTNQVKLETLSRVTTENVNQIITHLGYHVDINWAGETIPVNR